VSSERLRRLRIRSVLVWIFVSLTLYVVSFYVLMVPNLPAYDSHDKPVFNNCPRFSESVRMPGPFSIYAGRTNFLNYVYFPFEWIYSGSPKQGENSN